MGYKGLLVLDAVAVVLFVLLYLTEFPMNLWFDGDHLKILMLTLVFFIGGTLLLKELVDMKRRSYNPHTEAIKADERARLDARDEYYGDKRERKKRGERIDRAARFLR